MYNSISTGLEMLWRLLLTPLHPEQQYKSLRVLFLLSTSCIFFTNHEFFSPAMKVQFIIWILCGILIAKERINSVCLKDDDACHLLRRKTQRICRASISRHKLVLLIHRVLTLQNPHLGLIFLLWRKTVFAIIIWLGPLTLFCALFIKESFLKLHRGFFPLLLFLFLLFFVLHKRDSSVKNTFSFYMAPGVLAKTPLWN